MSNKAIAFAEDGSRVETSTQLWELQIMAHANKPLFSGRLENDWWKESKTLSKGMGKGYIEIVPGKGFIITEKGLELLKKNKLHTSRSPLGEFSNDLDRKRKKSSQK